ncbi:hypothetical protein [Haloferax volcanii]|uniref:hypothetical protein n=1 Tax=Haloferax volcanii TaxID=2246 RepID=UPI00249BED3E|nr:hypothetical protein [Haloferax alexandrinus]
MVNRGTVQRIRSFGPIRIVTSFEVIGAALLTAIARCSFSGSFQPDGMSSFVAAATGISSSLIAVVLTGIAILVSLSSEQFLSFLREQDIYDRIMFVFEYTVALAIITSLLGSILQAVEYSEYMFWIFVFFFIYLLLSTMQIVSTIIEYGDKIGEFSKANNFEPNEDLKKDMQDLIQEHGNFDEDDNQTRNRSENESESE